MTPIGSNLIVKPEESIKSFGNIILPEAMWEKVNRGTVISSGEKVPITPGSTVAYMKGAGTPFNYDGADVLILDNQEIYATL